MGKELASKPRPYWHVDAKWITGLLLVLAFTVTMMLYALVQITAEQPAVEMLTKAMALMFSQNGLDDPTEFTEISQRMRVSPDKTVQPIPGLRITVREQEIRGMTPREMRLYFFRKWAEPIYQDGVQGLAALADDPDLKSQIIQGGGFFNVMTLKTHQALQQVLAIATIACLLLLAPLVFFSYRFGRVGSPGCVLFIASLPGAILFTFISLAVRPMTSPPVQESGINGMIGYLLSNTLPPLAQIASQSYLVFLALGLGLMLLAVSSSTVWALRQRSRSHVTKLTES